MPKGGAAPRHRLTRLACLLTLLAGGSQASKADEPPDYGQLPCERQRFKQVGPSKTYTTSHSWIEVSYATLYENAKAALAHLAPKAIPLAVVKGHGFGHSLTLAARAFVDAGFKELGVADLNEAITLRQFGIDVPLHIMFQPDHLSAREMAYEEQLNVYVEEPSFVAALCHETSKASRTQPIQVHIMVATRRVGRGVATVAEALALARLVEACPDLALRGLATHQGEYEVFKRFVRKVEGAGVKVPLAHMASSAHLMVPETHLDMVRLGAVLYAMGAKPPAGILPAARWLTRIVRISKVRKNELLREDDVFATRDMTVAHIYNSFLDGYTADEVLLRGRFCSRIDTGPTMGPALIDVTALPEAAVGDLVVLRGSDPGSSRSIDQPRNLAQVAMVIPRIPIWP